MDLTLHQQLKQSTKDLHRELDHHTLFYSLLTPHATEDDIQRALQFWWGFQHAVEARINQAFLTIESNYFSRPPPKLDALERDMSAFNIEPLNTKSFFPKVTTCSELAALLYVSEGSMLGGVFIQRKLEKILGKDAAKLHYLSFYEPDTHQYWNTFLEQLELASTAIDHQTVTDAAQSWFYSSISLADEVCNNLCVYE